MTGMTERHPDPMVLTKLALGSSSLVAFSSFLLLYPLPEPHAHGAGLLQAIWALRWRFLGYGTAPLAGVVLWKWAEWRFRKAFRRGMWTETELVPVQRYLSLPVWKRSGLALFGIAIFILLIRKSMGPGFLLSAAFLPTHAAHRLRIMITPAASEVSPFSDMQEVRPLHSAYWGEPKG